jgi:hypothetical protein
LLKAAAAARGFFFPRPENTPIAALSSAPRPQGWPAAAVHFLLKPRGDRRWDLFLRSSAVVAALGIPLLLIAPDTVTLVWLALLSLPANSPLSPILPAAFEPVIMEAAKYARVVPVTLVATTGYMYMEYLNWHVYAWVINWERLEGFRNHRSVRWGMDRFARQPFWTVVVFAFTPLPFWAARSLAILHGYSLRRFLVATLLGRLPRIFAYAWLGGLVRVPTLWLVAVVVVTTLAAVASRLWRGEPLLIDSAPPVDSIEQSR